MKITFANGSTKEYDSGVTVGEVAKSLGGDVYRVSVAGKLDGKTVDFCHKISSDCNLSFITAKDKEGLDIYRHTCAHVLAQALKIIYPTCSLAIGPVIENGFYYDVDFKTPISQEDFDKIEDEMRRIIKGSLPIERYELSKKQAIERMKDFGELYKVQIIEQFDDDEPVVFYKQGAFTDMCKGPHLPTTGRIKAFKLTALTGAYWKGDSKNKMLYRIYGTAFEKKSQLEEYLQSVEEAKKGDHNKIGRELGFFATIQDIGQGLPVILPKGAKTIQVLQRFVEDEEYSRGYLPTKTPMFAKKDFYKTAGYLDAFKEEMFMIGNEETEKDVFALRPMSCPFQFQAYLNKPRSYRELPLKYNETSTLFRNEDSGEMHGLIKLRQFTISEGHVICRPDQLVTEFKDCLDLALYSLRCLGLIDDVSFRFSKRSEENKVKYVGTAKEWKKAQSEMKKILDGLNLDYEEVEGEAAFYGPKLDVQIKNVYGRSDTLITIQIDFQLSKKFDMDYTDSDGNKKYPYVIHRTSIGCYERTLALLLEKYAGALPLWISPVQVKVLTVTKNVNDYALNVCKELSNYGIRAEVDLKDDTIGKKIRTAHLEKLPYILVIGKEEKSLNQVSVRKRGEGDIGKFDLKEFILKVLEENNKKTL